MSSTRARATTQVEAGATTDANARADAGAANDAAAKAAVPAVPAVAAPDGGEVTSRGLVVVGPGASFGVELLRRFGEEGFALGVVTRSAETLGRIRGELAAQELTVSGLVADVTDAAGLTRAIERVATEIGGLTALVYNAKISIRGAALTVAPATLTETFAVNVTGALATIQAGVGPLTQRPGATIVLTSTSPRTAPVAGRFTLAVGKSGLTALAEALRPVLAARGVRLRTVLLDGRIAPDGPLRPRDVAEHFWQAYAAPRGDIFRLAPVRRDTPVAQLPLEV
ncbi:SDR family NAD(P)-dependent oxidoreductase [Frankia sp. Ag45/Mut15]|uniref:SDR family NAD(P)-dependent oxidoreductase n=1 Tax=Frankia umida TaxID=573489 RepID=A0ABT0K1A7_9ACTN|nr:SDR family NAD(P)-dependent oxidoreductase [Frankia umida]MCK9877601.1 SDR family NAD(P)-dependent oxidoreductase [Frankia umida]